ncbi:DUF1002 domain-containing protein [Clostridium hydrogeniformans]|uniref:DUF1002 domain-containing protein n=1 Tax=Clostridium hydrogeniformans TaxID=349933 RepID=UPI00068C8F3F|nr:DUF1002 domain-containing protein [Clostridium hydrogeniformans]
MKFKKTLSKILLILFTITLLGSLPSKKAHADAFKVVTLGADLTKEQKEDMLKYFGVDRKEANVLEVTIDEEEKYLKGVASSKQLGTRSISSSFVEPTSSGGLKISTNNIYWVTEGMIRNALITAGIKNAEVKASAPFNVSGTAALTGILKGFENSKKGEKIDEDKKKAANQEIVVTGDLGEKIGQDDAANLINEIKKDVVKEKPKNEKEIEKIVKKETKNHSKLNDDDVKTITELMDKINKLDLNFKDIKDQLNQVTKDLKDKLTSEEAKGFFSKIGNFFSNAWDSITDFFSDLFSSNSEEKEDTSKVKEENTSKNKESSNTPKENNNKASNDEGSKDTTNNKTSNNENTKDNKLEENTNKNKQ